MSLIKKSGLSVVIASLMFVFGAAPAMADNNPFTTEELPTERTCAPDGKCGEGKCGDSKKAKKDGKCGEGKCGG